MITMKMIIILIVLRIKKYKKEKEKITEPLGKEDGGNYLMILFNITDFIVICSNHTFSISFFLIYQASIVY